MKSDEQTSSTQDAPTSAAPATPERVVSVEPLAIDSLAVPTGRTVTPLSSRRDGSLGSDGSRRGEEIQESRPPIEDELSEGFEKSKGRLIEKYMQFIEEYDEETNKILAQLPGVLEHLAEGSTKEIKLGLDSEKERKLGFDEYSISRMNYYEQSAKIADLPIPKKIKHLKERLEMLEEENRQKETTSERKEEIRENLEFLGKHQMYLTSMQETLQGQYEELKKAVEKYKGKRNELRNLQNLQDLQDKLEKKDQDYFTFLYEQPLLSIETRSFLLEQALQRYKPKVVSSLILSRAGILVH